jgi:short-subunit dehydrogenase
MADTFVACYGPWAVVAGASEGIGAAFARALADRGLDLLLIARRPETLAATAEAIRREHGVRVETLALDLGAPDLEARLRAGVGEREVGLMVYNAARSQIGGFFELSLADKLAILDVNCRGPLVLCDLFGREMVARGRGGIVLMGSLAGLQGSPGIVSYAASKAFDLILAEGLWGELGERGVDVLACVAGATRTPGFEANASGAKGPVMEPEAVVAEALAALGRQPRLIPGLANKLASLAMAMLPRRQRIEIMKSALG